MRTFSVTDEKVRTLVFDGEEFKASWTLAIEDTMREIHGVTVADELSSQLLATIDEKYNLTDEEMTYCRNVLENGS